MKISTLAACVAVVWCAGVATAQIMIPAPCQNVAVQQHFHTKAVSCHLSKNFAHFDSFIYKKYLGRWYEHKKYFTYFQRDGKCVSATYKDNMNGTILVRNYMVNVT